MIERELTIQATTDNYSKVLEFVERILEETGCPQALMFTLDICMEEIYINIASYAYSNSNEQGDAYIKITIDEDPYRVTMVFKDSGMQYNPLEKEDPDITLSAQERQIGGLGIYMVKNMMDDVTYEYIDGQNVLTISKTNVEE